MPQPVLRAAQRVAQFGARRELHLVTLRSKGRDDAGALPGRLCNLRNRLNLRYLNILHNIQLRPAAFPAPLHQVSPS